MGPSSSPSACEDRNQYCVQWFILGHCVDGSVYRRFMTMECRVSCGMCSPVTTPTAYVIEFMQSPSTAPTAITTAATTRSIGIETDTSGLLPLNTVSSEAPGYFVDHATASTEETTVAGSTTATVGAVVVSLMVCCLGLGFYMRLRRRQHERHTASPMHGKRVTGFDVGGMDLPFSASPVDGTRPETPTWDTFDNVPGVTPAFHEEDPLRRSHRLTTCLTGESCTDADVIRAVTPFIELPSSEASADAPAVQSVAGEQGIVDPGEVEAPQPRLMQPMASSESMSSVTSISSMGTVQDWDKAMQEIIKERKTTNVATSFMELYSSEAGPDDDPAAQRQSSPGLADPGEIENFTMTPTERISTFFDESKNFTMLAPATVTGSPSSVAKPLQSMGALRSSPRSEERPDAVELPVTRCGNQSQGEILDEKFRLGGAAVSEPVSNVANGSKTRTSPWR